MQHVKRITLSPAVIITAAAAAGLVLNVGWYDGWGEAQMLYVTGIGAFLMSYIAVVAVPVLVGMRGEFKGGSLSVNIWLIRLYWFLAFLSVCGAVFILLTKGMSGPGDLFFNLRYSHTAAQNPTYGIGHLSLFASVLALYYLSHNKLTLAMCAITITALANIVLVQRTGLLFHVLAFVYFGYAVGAFRFRAVVCALVIFLFLAIALAAGSGKLYSHAGDFFVVPYIGYGITSFESWIIPNAGVGCWTQVLGTVIGTPIDYISGRVCGEYVGAAVGHFNVYTYLGAPYLAGGLPFVVLAMSVLGALYAALRMAAARSKLALMLLAYAIYPLVMVFYDWQFSLTTYWYLVILALPFFVRIGSRCTQSTDKILAGRRMSNIQVEQVR